MLRLWTCIICAWNEHRIRLVTIRLCVVITLALKYRSTNLNNLKTTGKKHKLNKKSVLKSNTLATDYKSIQLMPRNQSIKSNCYIYIL